MVAMPLWSQLAQDRLLVDYSLWSADLANLAASIHRTEACADLYHVDVADGHFVPSLLFFPDLLAALRPLTAKPFHVHLMTQRPEHLVADFLKAGADIITVHAENDQTAEVINQVKQAGKAVGLAVQLHTPLELVADLLEDIDLVLMMGTLLGIKGVGLDDQAVPRLQAVRKLIDAQALRHRVKLSADGGIREHTVPQLRAAGADMITPGSLVFKSQDLYQTTAWLHSLAGPEAVS
jgi:ribulose-phosphate 3-epimerase